MRKFILAASPGGQRFSAWRADRFLLRLRGLMGRTLRSGDAMLLSPCNQVHCFFMKSPIDVIYLSRLGEVLQITLAMMPNTIGKRVRAAYQVLELFEGDAARLCLSVGGRIIVKG